MALIKCSECEKEISDKATSCPNCGCPLNNLQTQSTTPVFQDENNQTSATLYSRSIHIPVKTIAIVICVIIILGNVIIYFCNRKPSNISDEMYNYGESTIKVIDDYMDNEIDYDSAAQKLDGIVSSIDYYESENEEEHKSSDFLIEADISILKSELFLEHLGKSTYSELLDSRNNLAEQLNISKRRK